MLIEDHINLQGGSPIAGKGIDSLGNRFVDMSEPYDRSLKDKAIKIAATKNVIKKSPGLI